MAYFEFTGTAPQTQQVRQLKSQLQVVYELAQRIQDQNAQMDDAQQTSQWGVPVSLAGTPWETLIDNLVTGLETAAVQNIITQLGFTT